MTRTSNDEQIRDNQLEIRTFGRFDVRYGNDHLSDRTHRSKKLWRIFLYLLQNINQEVPTEQLTDYFWDDRPIHNPQAALHNIIYRLRDLFDQLPSPHPLLDIEYAQVGYILRLSDNAWYDVNHFMDCIQQARSFQPSQPGPAIDHYFNALSIYQGPYLPGRSFELWVISAGRYYRQLYAEAVRELLTLLRRPARYSDIITVCERALAIESFLDVDELHYGYMESLAKMGRTHEALRHYNQLSKRMVADYGRQPSNVLQNLNTRIKQHPEGMQAETQHTELITIRRSLLSHQGNNGAYLCDRDVFRNLLQIESRRRAKTSPPSSSSWLGLVSLIPSRGVMTSPPILARAMTSLEHLLVSRLRQGDAVTQWNGNQFLILLKDCERAFCHQVLKRIQSEFEQNHGTDPFNCTLDIEIV